VCAVRVCVCWEFLVEVEVFSCWGGNRGEAIVFLDHDKNVGGVHFVANQKSRPQDTVRVTVTVNLRVRRVWVWLGLGYHRVRVRVS
jgi:hypothetical protein